MFEKLLKQLITQIEGKVTDDFLGLLLNIMGLTFRLSRGYRKNIKDFSGRYVFCTADGRVTEYVVFQDGRMKVYDSVQDVWNVKVTFKDATALRNFIFSRDQDIVDSILANDVEVDGNLNYIYKFGFMARDLGHRLGVV